MSLGHPLWWPDGGVATIAAMLCFRSTARRATALGLLAGGLAAAGPAPAPADSIVFTDGANVFAQPDGRPLVQLTRDGTPDTPPYGRPDSPRGTLVGPWFSASADDQGRLLAARAYRNDDGSDGSNAWIFSGPDGQQLARNLVSMRLDCGTYMRAVGPAAARIHPSGRWVAFMYQCGEETLTALNFPDRQTTPMFDPPDWGFVNPTWFGDRIVASDMSAAVAQRAGEPAPFTDDWFVTDIRAADLRFVRTEYTRDGSRAATLIPVDGGGRLLALLRTAPPLAGGPQAELQCLVPTSGSATTMSWSSDGGRIAWRDDAGVQVAAVPPREAGAGESGLCPMAPAVVAAGGREPVFTAYTYGAAPGGGGPGGGTPGGSGAPGGGSETPDGAGAPGRARAPGAARLRLTLTRTVTVAALRRGLTATVRAPGAGRVSVTVRAGRTLLAGGSASARRAAPVRVRLTLSRAGRGALRSLPGKRLTVRAVFRPRSGATRSATATVRVRR